MNEHGMTSLAKDRIGGFHQEAADRQVARQVLTGRNRFRFLVAISHGLSGWFAYRIERPLRAVALNTQTRIISAIKLSGARVVRNVGVKSSQVIDPADG